MRQLLFLFTFLCILPAFSQNVKELKPEIGYLVDLSSKGEKEFNKEKEKCEEIWSKVANQEDYKNLSETDKAIYDNCSEDFDEYYSILGIGCSWYCGGGLDTVSASSELKQHKNISYSAKNIHDLNYKTAWVEGVPGYGIGEFVMYHFPPENPRITEIIIVNGYIKSDKAWRQNSRVKTLKMYLDDTPFAILNLADSKNEQHFKFEPIGYGDRDDFDQLKTKPQWTLRFEIMEVYKGDKYDDTAISEIYFDGIDVH